MLRRNAVVFLLKGLRFKFGKEFCMLQSMVVYSSRTGNTQKIATRIFAAIPGDSKDMQRIGEYQGKDAELFFVGFWTDKGDCCEQAAELLQSLHGKCVALFGTCGMRTDDAYYDNIREAVRKWLPEDNIYLGTFMCQGKMPMQVRNRYEAMLSNGENPDWMRAMMRNFDEAMLHPDRADELAAEKFAKEVVRKAFGEKRSCFSA